MTLVLMVECPFCGYQFTTTTIKRVKCYNCERTFKVYYKTKKGKEWVLQHRVVGIVRGTREELMKRIMKIK